MEKEKFAKNCFLCKKPFETNRRQQIYCSEYCRNREQKKEPKICPNCKDIFKPTHLSQIYCSKFCSTLANGKRMNAKHRLWRLQNPIITKENKCSNCGKKYIQISNNHRYCSVKCRSDIYKSNHLDILSTEQPYWLKLRFDILRRDGFTCQYCGRTAKEGAKMNVDHILPKSKGGLWETSNLVTACYECNQGKKDVVLTQREIEKLQR